MPAEFREGTEHCELSWEAFWITVRQMEQTGDSISGWETIFGKMQEWEHNCCCHSKSRLASLLLRGIIADRDCHWHLEKYSTVGFRSGLDKLAVL